MSTWEREGWSSRSQQYRARRLGYSTPAQYRAEKSAAAGSRRPMLPMAASPAVPKWAREGWSSRAQQSRAQRLGYSTPAQYRAEKNQARVERRAIEPSPAAALLRRVRGVDVQDLGGGKRGLVSDRANLGNLQRELERYTRPDRRVSIYIGGKAMGGKRGFTIGYVREMIAEHGSLEAWIEQLEAGGYSDDGGGSAVSVTL